ncbi:MAG: hypothetical protein IJ079_04515 [Lachnospiraceae bacterium]|nr:hypothetical protein [Lachnospiraceae bacterium]MBR1567797.1 hypothetical protein [Lachnospiraceae bacterium]
MRKKQLLALATAGALVLAMAGCTSGGTSTEAPETDAPEVTEDATTDDGGQDTTGGDEATGEVSIDFEDGSISFAGVDRVVNPKPDESTLETAEYNGSKALKVIPSGTGSVYVGIQADALLGSDASKLKTVEMDLAVESQGSEFAAVSGNIYGLVGEKNDQTAESWSIYLENQNPKTVSYTVPDDYSFGEGNYIVVSMESYAGDPANLYIDNIAFKDVDGNVLSADTSAEIVAADTGVDRSNLFGLINPTDIEGSAFSGDAWSQNGITLSEDQLAQLVPGSVIEISYSSETGHIWVLFNAAEAGWIRVGEGLYDGEDFSNLYAYTNSSGTTAQITYEQLASIYGEDVSTWGDSLQCESDGAWEVYDVKIGTAVDPISIGQATEIENSAFSGSAWSQNGIDLTEDQMALLVPGSVIEVSFSSETNHIWVLFPGAEAGWGRVGEGLYDGEDFSNSYAYIEGDSVAYVTYEQLADYLGEDTSKWGTTLQCESDGEWEVYSVRIGTALKGIPNNNVTEIPDSAFSGDGWSQNGITLDADTLALLVPGSVINISFSSEDNNIWVLFNAAEAGWIRVGEGLYDGEDFSNAWAYVNPSASYAQITYEQLAAQYGEDVTKWGDSLQCESSNAWEVYSVSIGQTE